MIVRFFSIMHSVEIFCPWLLLLVQWVFDFSKYIQVFNVTYWPEYSSPAFNQWIRVKHSVTSGKPNTTLCSADSNIISFHDINFCVRHCHFVINNKNSVYSVICIPFDWGPIAYFNLIWFLFRLQTDCSSSIGLFQGLCVDYIITCVLSENVQIHYKPWNLIWCF